MEVEAGKPVGQGEDEVDAAPLVEVPDIADARHVRPPWQLRCDRGADKDIGQVGALRGDEDRQVSQVAVRMPVVTPERVGDHDDAGERARPEQTPLDAQGVRVAPQTMGLTLNNSVTAPQIGLGVWPLTDERAYAAASHALVTGTSTLPASTTMRRASAVRSVIPGSAVRTSSSPTIRAERAARAGHLDAGFDRDPHQVAGGIR